MEDTAQLIRQAVGELLPDIIADGLKYYQKAIAAKGIVNEGSLLNSLSHQINQETEGLVASITFNEYGRFRDMPMLRWSGTAPNIEDISKWVEQKGPASFAYVPGYEYSSAVPTETIAIRRITNAIVKNLSTVEATKKKYKGTWYNETTMKMVNITKVRILNRVAVLIAQQIKTDLEIAP